ncbi:iron exporter MbfA [Beijerinckia indica]|uniref:Rubrerythrin n=1 Tax=Beijerinckia indica subsp. indica (strain ATCC 9039 / DSM 1715 / NCIMB 8712) TaxID=395963 RepID=B2IER0_BEII9|nr:ferritin family protein [Beijerinckia indica]ACB97000.1 Rubrerythrin [Beijerinckia indica subsp. indica ATCC 9039]
MKNFSELSEREILCLAIAGEEEDNRVYSTFAEDLADRYPATAKVFAEMAQTEATHREMLNELYKDKFGPELVPISKGDVNFFIKRPPVWLTRNLSLDTIRREAEIREAEAASFYVKAAASAKDPAVRQLLRELAQTEMTHEEIAADLETKYLTVDARKTEEMTHARLFVLQYVQPGLAGLMDGSVSTLAPLFAAAFATHNNWKTFLVGLAASLGGGVSMGFAEALSDDGTMTGRGAPLLRGLACGLMTTIGGLGHTLPYLVPDEWPNAFLIATSIAGVVVFFELWAIAFMRTRYMKTPFLRAVLQVIVGGLIVLITGILIGGA